MAYCEVYVGGVLENKLLGFEQAERIIILEVRLKLKWENDSCPQSLLKDIKDQLSINKQGNLTQKIGIEFSIDGLFGRVIHSYSLDYEVLFSVFCESVRKAYKLDRLKNPDFILDEFKKLCEDRLKIKNEYVLVTSMNIKNQVPKKRKIGGCGVNFTRNLPNKYRKDRVALAAIYSHLKLEEQEGYIHVVVSVTSSDVKTAFKTAVGALDVFRAILQIGFRKPIDFLANKKREKYPSDSIVTLGQFHTLHLKNGKKACETVWYEDSFRGRNPISIKDIDKTEASVAYYLRKINKSFFQEHISNSLKNYINALDALDLEHRYMKLCSTMEQLVKSDNSSIIIKRVSFFCEDRSSNKQLLESLRKARNVSTHAGALPYNVEMKNYRVCMYLDDMLRFFILNPFGYNKLSKLLEFISLSTEATTIEEQIKNLKKVKLFIGS